MRLLLSVLVVFVIVGCSADVQNGKESGKAAAEGQDLPDVASRLAKANPVGAYGVALSLPDTTPITEILSRPEAFEGNSVRLAGVVEDVCPMAGCWIELAGDGASIRVKVEDGKIVFPKSAKGHPAVVEGVVEKLELDREEAAARHAHMAEEQGEVFDPASITGPEVIWRIRGRGAEISE